MNEEIPIEFQNKLKYLTVRAVNTVNCMVSETAGVTTADIAEFLKLINVYGAKIISKNSLKDGKHPNVRTVLNDIAVASVDSLDALIETNPELADDYVWPEDEPDE